MKNIASLREDLATIHRIRLAGIRAVDARDLDVLEICLNEIIWAVDLMKEEIEVQRCGGVCCPTDEDVI